MGSILFLYPLEWLLPEFCLVESNSHPHPVVEHGPWRLNRPFRHMNEPGKDATSGSETRYRRSYQLGCVADQSSKDLPIFDQRVRLTFAGDFLRTGSQHCHKDTFTCRTLYEKESYSMNCSPSGNLLPEEHHHRCVDWLYFDDCCLHWSTVYARSSRWLLHHFLEIVLLRPHHHCRQYCD